MQRLRVRYRKRASNDLVNIGFYLRQRGASKRVALDYVERIRATCRGIGDAPEAGMPRDDLLPGLRTWSFERRAVVAYRVLPGAVQIVNVFYGGRDFDAFYARERRRLEVEP